MAVRPILQLGNPALRQQCTEVVPGSSEAVAVIADLRDTLAEVRQRTGYGRAIAAPQIGEAVRAVFINGSTPTPLLNPRITAASDEKVTVWDACLSYLCIFFQVERHRWIDVEYEDEGGAPRRLHAEGELSELLQHEIEHLDGVLAIDHVTDPRSFCTREEFELRHSQGSAYAFASGRQ